MAAALLAAGVLSLVSGSGAAAAGATASNGASVFVPAELRAAVSARPTDVLVAVDSAAGLAQMRAVTRSGLTRASRQAASALSAAAFAATKHGVLQGRSGITPTRDFPHLPLQLVRVDSLASLDALAATSGVVSLSLPKRNSPTVSSNLTLIGQPAAVAAGAAGSGTRVAVVDTGVDQTLAGVGTTFGDCSGGIGAGPCRIKRYLDVGGSGLRDVDPGHHGTNVSGIVATVAPATTLSVYNVFVDDPTFGVVAFDSDILAALDDVAAQAPATNTRSVNLSLGDGSYNTTACAGTPYDSAFATLRGVGVVPVVAAGNAAYDQGPFSNGISGPACAPGALSVGAVYSQPSGAMTYPACQDLSPVADKVTCFSQTGPLLSILAPGVTVTAAGLTLSGTSQASPHVAAAAAMLAGANPGANATAVTVALTTSGPVITDARSSPATAAHRLDLPAALSKVVKYIPDPPTAVAAVGGDALASVRWHASTSVLGTVVTGYTAIATPGGASCVTAGALSCTIAGLSNGTAYTVTVTATNSFGTSAASSPSAALTPAAVPGPPASVGAVPSSGQASVSWATPASDGGSPVTGYTVVATPGGASCVTTGALGCTVTGLTNGTAYSFTVTATNGLGTGPSSAPSAPVVPATVPGPPPSVSAALSSGQALVTWAAAATGGSPITGYTAVATPGGASCTTAGVLGCTITGLANGTAYLFTVTATNAMGAGPASAPSAPGIPLAVPGPPTSVLATAGAGQVALSWIAPADAGGSPVIGYHAVATPGGASCDTSAVLGCTVTGLTNGTAYSFSVVATNAVGAGPISAPSSSAVPITVPGPPAAPATLRGNGIVTVSWSPPADTGGSAITGYTVVARPAAAGCSTVVTRCTFRALVSGTAYTFVVRATSAAGAGAGSPPSARVIAATAPARPGRPAAVRGHGLAVVTWSRPASDGGSAITGYRAVASPGGRSCTTRGAVRCIVTGLVDGRAYRFTVTATNSLGRGAPATTTPAVVPAAVPGIPGAPRVVRGDRQATVLWSAPAPNRTAAITGYRVVATPGGRGCTAAVLRCTVTGLVNGVRYTFTVVAINRVGAGPASPGTVGVPARTALGRAQRGGVYLPATLNGASVAAKRRPRAAEIAGATVEALPAKRLSTSSRRSRSR
ncbi:MAG: fibronectin type III domain-containing protein [Actinomycetota bacterium]